MVIHHNILEHGTEVDSVEDVGLFFLGKVNALCIASALNVVDTFVAPAMFIVTNQWASRVSRQCCLAYNSTQNQLVIMI
jgi:hypothetical protein